MIGYPDKSGMFRFLTTGIVLALLSMAPTARAAVDESDWKKAVVEALNAAGAKDYPKAEQSFVQALHEAERFGPRDQRVGTTLNALGLVYRAEKKFSEAESAYRKALAIMEAAYGNSIDVANVNFNIANVMLDQGHQADALPYIGRTLSTYEKLLGRNSLKTAGVLCMQGDTLRALKRYQEAEGPLRRCADAREANEGVDKADVADALYSLALVYAGEGKFSQAEPRFKLVEKIREKTAGITSPLLAQTLEDHAAMLKSERRDTEAGKLLTMASAIRRSQGKTGQ